MVQSQLVVLYGPAGGCTPSAIPRPLRRQVVNKANSKDELVPTNIRSSVAIDLCLLFPFHLNLRSFIKVGYQ